MFVPISRSSPDTVRSPVTTTSPENVALPASAIAKVRAFTLAPPSLPAIVRVAFDVPFLRTQLPDPLWVKAIPVLSPVPALNVMSSPSASRTISPATSMVRSPDDRSISVPSMVMLSMSIPASAVIRPLKASISPSK